MGHLLTWLQVHFPHAVNGYHAYLVIEVVLVDIAFLENDLEQESDLVHIDALQLSGLEI